MFNKGIYETMLTSEVAERLFSNITASNALDQTFLATLRIMAHKRLPQNETVHFTCKRIRRSVSELSYATANDCMSWFTPDAVRHPVTSEHGIHIVYEEYPEAGEKMLEIVNANVGRRYLSNYKRRDDLQVFYARKAKALFYTDDTEKNTIIFAKQLELKHFHVLQMMIPKYLPRLFAENPLTEKEILLLKSTGNKYATEYEKLLDDFANDFDIRAEIIRSKLAGFETVFERIRADELRDEINSYQDSYELHLSTMRELAHKMQECKYTLAGIESVINDHAEDSELMEYFMCNKHLTIIRVTGTIIEFVVHGYADVYDVEAFEQYVSNHSGFMYASISPSISKSQLEGLYHAIFNEGVYKLRMCAAYRADMRTGLKACQSYAFPMESQTYFPNPHIQEFGCIGSYSGRFQEYMQRRDYVGAIDQAVVSARNLNFYDSTVISRFASDFSRTRIKCIEKSDGTLLTPLEAINELEGGAAECQDQ